MTTLDTTTLKHITCYGGVRGRLNWPMDAIFKDGTKKRLKRDAIGGVYVVIDRVRNYFPQTSFVHKTNLFSEMKGLL